MLNAFERQVAFRYLRPKRKEGFISVIAGFSFLGIALGVATLIIVMSVMNGFRQELLGRILGINGHLHVYGQGESLSDYDAIAQRLRDIPGVITVAPMIEGQALVNANGVASGAVVRGMREPDFAGVPMIHDGIRAGDLSQFNGDNAAIGQRLASRLGLHIGDKLTLLSPKGAATAFGMVPTAKAFTVAVIYEIGMYEYDNGFVFLPLETAQRFFRLGDTVTAVELRLTNPDDAFYLRGQIQRSIDQPTRVLDWQMSNASFFDALQVERNVMFLILTLIILVADFNIISSMIMLVRDKTRDIAILRTMGATRGAIMRIFCLSGASIGVIGTLIGFTLGVLFVENIESIRQGLQTLTGLKLFPAEIYFLTRMPAELDWNEVLWVLGMAMALSFAATLYPAWRAARLNPVEALRYE
jgi:lipoprotein-releasing system permease protein